MSKVMELKHRLNLARQMIKWSPEDVETWWNTSTSQEREFLANALEEYGEHLDKQLLSMFDHTEAQVN